MSTKDKILPGDPRYLRELGIDADRSLIPGLVTDISNRWTIPPTESPNPTLILFGGFQGSGKTSVTEALTEHLQFITVSPDEIRHELFKHIEYSEPVFSHTVHAARNELVKKAFNTRRHVVLDQNATPARLALNHMLAAQYHYHVLSIYLDAPKEILEQRVTNRKPKPGQYNGTVEELRASMDQQPEVDKTVFDHVFNTGRQSAAEIAGSLKF